jgi:hypothetical protein
VKSRHGRRKEVSMKSKVIQLKDHRDSLKMQAEKQLCTWCPGQDQGLLKKLIECIFSPKVTNKVSA